MAQEKFYPESELVQRLQNGEIGWLDFVNMHSKAWKDEMMAYCQEHNMLISNDSAEQFVIHKGEELEKALAEGNA